MWPFVGIAPSTALYLACVMIIVGVPLLYWILVKSNNRVCESLTHRSKCRETSCVNSTRLIRKRCGWSSWFWSTGHPTDGRKTTDKHICSLKDARATPQLIQNPCLAKVLLV